MSTINKTTLRDYLKERLGTEGEGGELATIIESVAECSIAIVADLRQGALGGYLGEAGTSNVQGEDQKKFDVVSNDIMKSVLRKNPNIRGVASEEETLPVSFVDDGSKRGGYLALFDPLDGSSNMDVNVSVGTIFSIFKSPKKEGGLEEAEFLQPGKNQLAAGYVLYGPQSVMVLATAKDDEVAMFTLDPQRQVYVLTRQNVRVPRETKEFAINMSNRRFWEEPVREWIDEFLMGEEGPKGKNYNMRWVASMVAEVHRILTRGGVFSYPKDSRDPSKPGKLRLMYEANPMSLLVTKAGGRVTNGIEDMLDVKPEKLHQRVAVFLGAKDEVDDVMRKMGRS